MEMVPWRPRLDGSRSQACGGGGVGGTLGAIWAPFKVLKAGFFTLAIYKSPKCRFCKNNLYRLSGV